MNSLEVSIMQATLRSKVAACVANAKRVYPDYARFADPNVKFINGRTRAGTANYGTNTIGLNIDMAMANADSLNDTIPHEVAHLVAKYVFGERGHGRKWKVVCIMLGGDGKRCFDPALRGVEGLVAGRRRVIEYSYTDSRGGTAWVGPVHHNRLQAQGIRGYALKNAQTGAKIAHTGYTGESRMRGAA